MKPENSLLILMSATWLLTFLLGGVIVKAYDDGMFEPILSKFDKPRPIPQELEDCRNLSLQDTAFCLRDYIKPYVNYTISPDTPRTWDEIKESGGDCYDYSLMYYQFAKNLGFKATMPTMDTGDARHRVTIISGNLSYCLIDFYNVDCAILSTGEGK